MVIIRLRRCGRCRTARLCPDEIADRGIPTCHRCARDHQLRYEHEQRERDERRREQMRAASRRWKRRNAARVNENERLRYRLRAEREGRPVQALTPEQYRQRYGPGTGAGNQLNLDAAPLAALIRKWLDEDFNARQDHYGERNEGINSVARLERLAGVSSRLIRRILNDPSARCSVLAADRLALAVGTHLDLIYDDAPGVRR